MKVGQDLFPKSSFLSVDKDLSIIVKKLMTNQRLMKMLYFTQKDCTSAADLTMEQIYSMLNKQIKIIPNIIVDKECPIYIIVMMNSFTPNAINSEFRDCYLTIDILCHPDHWHLGNFALRPYKIAGEIDAMINNQKLTGIGETQFIGCDNLVLNDDLMGLTMVYRCIHGGEDEINPL